MTELTQEIVRELLDYDPETGLLTWKPRDAKWFNDGYRSAQANANNWNSNNAGKQAFNAKIIGRYNSSGIFGITHLAHRIIWLWMTGDWPKEDVDHIDGNGFNNKWNNLRSVSHAVNGRNSKLPIHNTSGIIGVSQLKNGKWKAQGKVNQIVTHIGVFDTKEQAIQARLDFNIRNQFHANHGRKTKNDN